MRNLLILCLTTIFILTSSLSANVINESKTDIYFGNGIWNLQFTKTKCKKQDAAECSQRYLDRLLSKEIIKNNPKLQIRYGKVKLAYNQTKGKFPDLLETFYQLKVAGQIGERTFFATVDELMAKSLADINDGVELAEMR